MIDRQGTSGGGTLLRRLVASVAALAVIGVGLIALSSPASASVSGRVITPAGVGLNVRSAPNTSAGVLRAVPSGSYVSFGCYVQGEAVTGPYGSETLWDQLDDGGYVSDAWIYTGSNGAVVPQCSSPQPPPPPQGGNQYRIAWTGGLGVYPRTSTSMSAPKVSPALAEGAMVTISCETTGETVTDTAGYTSSLWDQLNTGYYVANVYINTGTNGRTPGVPDCSTSSGGNSNGGSNPSSADCAGPADSGGYSGVRACQWAVANAYSPPRFLDDCTWFVSQALWAGGLSKDSVWTSASIDPLDLAVLHKGSKNGPYAYPGPSQTAALANKLVDYLVGKGKATRKTIYWGDNTAGGARIGDIIAYHWKKVGTGPGEDPSTMTIDHVALVTAFSGTYPLVSQHTDGQHDRGWSWSLDANNGKGGWIQYSYPPGITPIAYLIHIRV